VEDSLIGSADEVVLETAVSNGQIVVTFDSDFGELVYKDRYRPDGIIYFRWESFRPAEPGEFLHDILHQGDIVLEGYFTVIDRGAIRQRPI
jgi:predicted nuclease of predicted toxin-antitoxin system